MQSKLGGNMQTPAERIKRKFENNINIANGISANAKQENIELREYLFE
jgi:hypothetical protein